jgi:hypothetical protein
MKKLRCKAPTIFSMALTISFLALVANSTFAGGPLYLGPNGQPVLWPRTLTQGGALNSQTVDEQGRVLYRVDIGPLGSLPNDKAVALIDRIFNLYSAIPTSTLKFANAGPIKDPATGQPVDVTSANFARIRSNANPAFQNPIIFDSDGSITGSGGVLGFFGPIQIDSQNNVIKEGLVVLNGAALDRIGAVPFLGVFTHEIAHLVGPLDHSQINGAIASGNASSLQPAGYTRGQAFDLYMPFVETLYPFIFSTTSGSSLNSQLANSGFGSSGFFIASLDFDTQAALSSLYPTPEFSSTLGAIEGRVVIKTPGGEIPLTGVNVVARRISRGAYPPPLSSTAFPDFPTTSLQLDEDGVPVIPPDQDSTDSLATAASAVTGLQFGSGRFKIAGLPEGQYLLQIQQINQSAVGGSGIGPLDRQIPLPVLEQNYNGTSPASSSPDIFVPVTVSQGVTTANIDIVLGGLDTAAFTSMAEVEPNEKSRKGQAVQAPVEITGSASGSDISQFKLTLSDNSVDTIEDFFRFTVATEKIYYILLEPTDAGASGDLDMYLFNADLVAKKRGVVGEASILGSSSSPTANEVIAMKIPPGTYTLGVSAFRQSNLSYRLRIIPAQ